MCARWLLILKYIQKHTSLACNKCSAWIKWIKHKECTRKFPLLFHEWPYFFELKLFHEQNSNDFISCEVPNLKRNFIFYNKWKKGLNELLPRINLLWGILLEYQPEVNGFIIGNGCFWWPFKKDILCEIFTKKSGAFSFFNCIFHFISLLLNCVALFRIIRHGMNRYIYFLRDAAKLL